MEYRGVSYTVIQTADGRWRWSVPRQRREKFGYGFDRGVAIMRAKKFIDEMLKKREMFKDDRSDLVAGKK
jgi:hypothetical protein